MKKWFNENRWSTEDKKLGDERQTASSPCRSCCGLWGACSETLTAAETPAPTASSWDARWLLNPCWLSEIRWKRWTVTETRAFLNSWTDSCEMVNTRYLLSLDLTAEVWDLDLHGVELVIGDLGDGKGLGLLGTLEGQLSQGDVPLTVILLVLPAAGGWMTSDERCRWVSVCVCVNKNISRTLRQTLINLKTVSHLSF